MHRIWGSKAAGPDMVVTWLRTSFLLVQTIILNDMKTYGTNKNLGPAKVCRNALHEPVLQAACSVYMTFGIGIGLV